VRSRNTLEALRLLEAAGVLSAADHTILSDGYRFLRRVENALRLAHDRPVEDLDREDIDLGLVARRLSFPGPAHRAAGLLWEEYKRRREAIRSCYDKWFDRADQGFA
jgi:glutamate-ammonia-ligase adenylyltransferase